jgi:hypothetical protein
MNGDDNDAGQSQPISGIINFGDGKQITFNVTPSDGGADAGSALPRDVHRVCTIRDDQDHYNATQDVDSNGNIIYRQTFDDGSSTTTTVRPDHTVVQEATDAQGQTTTTTTKPDGSYTTEHPDGTTDSGTGPPAVPPDWANNGNICNPQPGPDNPSTGTQPGPDAGSDAGPNTAPADSGDAGGGD